MSANVRIQWLHKKIMDGSFPNAQRLSERFGISHRQAQRDLEFLKKELSAPLSYNPKRKGFYYAEDYVLPVLLTSYNDDLYIPEISSIRNEEELGADESIIQMQIPYSAILEIPDKLTVMELSAYVKSREAKNRYICEFHSVEKFIGTLFSLDSDFTIVEPDWLKEKVVQTAKRVLEKNS